MAYCEKLFLVVSFCLVFWSSFSQDSVCRSVNAYYAQRDWTWKVLWGQHYRREWATTVRLPVFSPERAGKLIIPVKRNYEQSSLEFKVISKDFTEYTIRPVDKFPQDSVPTLINVLLGNIIKDQVSGLYPYSALVIPVFAEAAGLFHTNPTLVYLPADKIFESSIGVRGRQVALLEISPNDDPCDSDTSFIHEDVINTAQLMTKLVESMKYRLDERLFAKCRLLDMWIGDWGRYEDHWFWTSSEEKGTIVYKPVSRDHDHAFFKFDGFFPWTIRTFFHPNYQYFGYHIRNLKGLNNGASRLDNTLLTEMSLREWEELALELQQELTDSVIEAGFKKIPKSVYSISGKEIETKLKLRRADLVKAACDFYYLLAKEVTITATREDDYIEIIRPSDKILIIRLFRIEKNFFYTKKPYYVRRFYFKNTNRVKIRSMGGKDYFSLEGNKKGKISLVID